MPFMKNLEGKVALALEPEVKTLEEAGWRVLDAAEEEAHRAGLTAAPELTSAAAQEADRVAAGVYKVVGGEVDKVEDAVEKPAKKTTKKAA